MTAVAPAPQPGGGPGVPVAPVLELREVSAAYGPFRAIFDVSFSVPRGKVVALLGANGAGKTTIARVCSGLVPVASGHLLLEGVDVSHAKAWRLARLGIVHAPEGRSVFSTLTVEENLTLEFRRSAGRREVASSLARAYELFPRLGERRRQLAGTLSGGEQRMLSLARVLVVPPKLLIVDELSLGLAPIVVEEVYAVLRRIKESGTSLLIIEQYVGHALSVADEIVLLSHGEVVYRGGAADVGDISEHLLA